MHTVWYSVVCLQRTEIKHVLTEQKNGCVFLFAMEQLAICVAAVSLLWCSPRKRLSVVVGANASSTPITADIVVVIVVEKVINSFNEEMSRVVIGALKKKTF
jgi:hypothetical protein